MRKMHGRQPHAWLGHIARILLVLLTVLPPATVLFAGSSIAQATSTSSLSTNAQTSKSTPTPTPTATTGGYTTTLTSPAPPVATSTYLWKISGVKPSPGQEISYATLSGCWSASQVVSATAQAARALPLVTVDASTGAVKVDNLSDKVLPITVSITYTASYASASSGTTVFIKTGTGSTGGITSTVAGRRAGVRRPRQPLTRPSHRPARRPTHPPPLTRPSRRPTHLPPPRPLLTHRRPPRPPRVRPPAPQRPPQRQRPAWARSAAR